MEAWLESTDERWQEVLSAAPHDFYHTARYVEFGARREGGAPVAYYVERGPERLLIPLLIRSLDGVPGASARHQDAASPYGYAGPVMTPGWSDSALERAMAGYVAAGARRGLVTTFLRLHPLLRAPGTQSRHTENISTVTHGPTVSVDLTLDVEALDRHVKPEYRRNVGKLRAAGFAARFDQWADYDEFQIAYTRTMEHLQAARWYHFDAAYFTDLRTALGDRLHLCSVVGPDGAFACGGLFTDVGGIVQYHLSASVDRYRALAPSKLMIHEVRLWAKRLGGRVLHLGGGVAAKRDSLYAFKRGFGTQEHEFQTVRVVHEGAAYAVLSASWLQASRRDAFPDTEFFPLYRSTVPPSD